MTCAQWASCWTVFFYFLFYFCFFDRLAVCGNANFQTSIYSLLVWSSSSNHSLLLTSLPRTKAFVVIFLCSFLLLSSFLHRPISRWIIKERIKHSKTLWLELAITPNLNEKGREKQLRLVFDYFWCCCCVLSESFFSLLRTSVEIFITRNDSEINVFGIETRFVLWFADRQLRKQPVKMFVLQFDITNHVVFFFFTQYIVSRIADR